MKRSPVSNAILECKVRGSLMADSPDKKNQHVLTFSFFMLAEERESFIPWANVSEVVAVTAIYSTHIERTSNWANQCVVVSLTS